MLYLPCGLLRRGCLYRFDPLQAVTSFRRYLYSFKSRSIGLTSHLLS